MYRDARAALEGRIAELEADLAAERVRKTAEQQAVEEELARRTSSRSCFT